MVRLQAWKWRGRKPGVRTTILLGFVAVLAIGGATLGGIWAEARLLRASYDSLRTDALATVSRLEDLKTVSYAYMQAVGAHAYAAIWAEGRAEQSAQAAKARDTTMRETRIRADRLSAAATSVANLDNLRRMGGAGDLRQDITDSIQRLVSQGQAVVDLANAGRQDDVPALLEQMRYGHAYLGKVLEGVMQQKRLDIATLDDAVRTAIDRVLLMLALAGAIAIPLTLLVGWYIANRIARPIRQLRDAAEHLAEGRFDLAMPKTPDNEIGDLANSFREMAQRLRRSMDALARQERLAGLGQVAATMSHELRNPLAVLHTTLATLRRRLGAEGADVQQSLARMDRTVDRCAEIIGDLQDFASAEAVTRELTVVDEWLKQLLDERGVIGSISLQRDLNSGALSLIDGPRLRRAITNLLDNAVEALTDGGWQPAAGRDRRISVRTESVGAQVRLTITDNGPGIPPDVLPHIFEPLFTTKSFGVGLGLPLVRQIIEQHGGTVSAEAPPEGGARFVVLLQRLSAESDATLAA